MHGNRLFANATQTAWTRLRRLLLAILVLLLAAQCTAWLASYRWTNLALLHSFGRRHAEHVIIATDRGVWTINRFTSYGMEGAAWRGRLGPFSLSRPFDRDDAYPEPHTWQELAWPRFERRPSDYGTPSWYLQVPSAWTVGLNLIPLVLYVAHVIRAGRRHNRARQGQCARCGYDLRMTPDRCPECGHAAGAA
jgi:hypothetical protein